MNKAYRVNPYTPRDTVSKNCAVCNSATPTHLLKIENNLNIVACDLCGFTFVNPRPSEAELNRFYQEYYPDTADVPESWKREMGNIFDESRELIFQHHSSGRILDIGCSYGFFVSGLPSASWEKWGVEPSSTATEYLAEHFDDIRVTTADFESVGYEESFFDVVTAFYVLEHVIDPRFFMEKVFSLLNRDGIAIIRIPYSRPFFRVSALLGRPLLQAPMHLSDFSPAHMTSMCRDIGFSQVKPFHEAHRYSVDPVESLGATVMSSIGKVANFLGRGRTIFPFYGAYSYLLKKS